MKKITILLPLILALLSPYCFAEDNLSTDEKAAVITGIKRVISSEYVFVAKIDALNNAVDELYRSGKYDDIVEVKAFAQALTDDLVAYTKDKHFAVTYNPKFIAGRRAWRERANATQDEQEQDKQEVEPTIDWNHWYGLQDNLGFKKLEVLDGNIGYIQSTFFQPLDWTRTIIDTAMNFVSNTDALIIDLRNNGGGYSPADAYLGSYFFDATPTLWMTDYSREAEAAETTYTEENLGGKRYLNKPVYILVSEKTFSLAEQLAYGLKHYGKATIVGTTTSGASHAIDAIDVDDNFLLQVPVEYSVHPISQANWEGVGVIPHIKTTSESALNAAWLAALNALTETATHERQKVKYKEVMEKISEE